MKTFVAAASVAAVLVAAVAFSAAACDPQSTGTPSPSVVVVHDDQHATAHVHGGTGRSRGPASRKAPRASTPRRSGARMTTPRRTVTVTKR
ncbi:hypothetical protein [Streptomyces sp. YIM S03343]